MQDIRFNIKKQAYRKLNSIESNAFTGQGIPLQAHLMLLLGSGSTTASNTCYSTTERQSPNLAHTPFIFQMLLEHLNFCTSISGTCPTLINGPHLSWHHVVCRPCPTRQLYFGIMGTLHPSPYHAMIVHLCDLSVNPFCQKGQQGMPKVEAIRMGRGWVRMQHDMQVQHVTVDLLLQLSVLTDKDRNMCSQHCLCHFVADGSMEP